MNKNEILELFSYTKREQETFSYLGKYMKKISPYLSGIIKSKTRMERFMLAGLFLTYRACNHIGRPMTTDVTLSGIKGIHRRRLQAFEENTGIRIHDAGQYLQMIGASQLKMRLFGPARILIRFVLRKPLVQSTS